MNIEEYPGKNNPGQVVDPADAFQPLLIENVVAGIGNLPTLPSVAAYLLNHVDEEVHLPKLVQMLSYDQVMTARILRFANSAFIGSNVTLKTVEEAVHLIGLHALREMVCISAVSGLLVPERCPDFALKTFWRHSVAAACCASSLAQHVGSSASLAFTAALLHDIGQIVLACAFPIDYARTLKYQSETACTLLEAEQATISIDHVRTGIELAKRWQLGKVLEAAIAGHHAVPLADPTGSVPLAAITFLSNRISHAVDLTDADDVSDSDAIRHGLAAIGLAEGQYPMVLAKARVTYRQALEALSL